jgi:hypothetical protein
MIIACKVEVAGSLQGVSLAVEVPEEMLAAVESLRTLAKRAGKAAKKADAHAEAVARHRAFAGLARWLQLHILGDPENADTGLANDLRAIYKDAFPKGSKEGALSLLQTQFCARDVLVFIRTTPSDCIKVP